MASTVSSEVKMTVADARVLTWDGLHNARDLGGHPTPKGQTRFGRVVRSECLGRLTSAGLAALRKYGIATVIDLRSPVELRGEASPLSEDPGYRNLPVLEDADMERVAAINSVDEVYRYMVEHRGGALAEALRLVAYSPWPVLVHCKAGKDRTGVVVALLLANAGVDQESIVADYAMSDSLLAPLYARWALEAGVDPSQPAEVMRRYASAPEAMRALLELLERDYGGARGYLLAAGLKEAELQVLRALLVEELASRLPNQENEGAQRRSEPGP